VKPGAPLSFYLLSGLMKRRAQGGEEPRPQTYRRYFEDRGDEPTQSIGVSAARHSMGLFVGGDCFVSDTAVGAVDFVIDLPLRLLELPHRLADRTGPSSESGWDRNTTRMMTRMMASSLAPESEHVLPP
jgi:hypothetical protein